MSLLTWHNLIFYIPLCLGMLMTIGMALGLTDLGEHGFDAADHDLDHDHSHDVLSVLGFGRCPASIVVTTMLLLFGGTGTVLNFLIRPLLELSSVFVVGSLVPALLVMFFGSSFVARTVARFLPTTETTSVRSFDLVGRTGRTLLETDHDSGLAQLRVDGDVFQVPARTENPGTVIAKDAPIMVLSYDEGTDAFIVIPDPVTQPD